jgi:heterodisulfide reductase subunit A
MLEVSQNKNIQLMTYSEVKKVEGYVGNYHAVVEMKPRYVDISKCTGCGACMEVCPMKKIPNEFNEKIDNRRAIYIPFQQAIPKKVTIDAEKCLFLTKGA